MAFGFTYQGNNVHVPWTADIPPAFKFGHPMAWAVEEALSRIEPWKKDEDPIETVELSRPIFSMVVPVADQEEIRWGVHKGHKAKRPGVSPFVLLSSPPRTTLFTIELTGTVQSPALVRAYAGSYVPPLPWMNSASRADGGLNACIEFWRTHAYIYRKNLVAGRWTKYAPDWYHS